jgi:hypothetical protein
MLNFCCFCFEFLGLGFFDEAYSKNEEIRNSQTLKLSLTVERIIITRVPIFVSSSLLFGFFDAVYKENVEIKIPQALKLHLNCRKNSSYYISIY